MDRFHTLVEIPGAKDRISYQTPCLFMGSCFADEIGERMQRLKFPVLLNPFGTLFNPASISNNLMTLINGKPYTGEDLFLNNGMWFSFSHYTGFARRDRQECLDNINLARTEAAAWLRQSGYLLITFGTAWTYIHSKTDALVANCHKLPAAEFTRKLLEPADIVHQYTGLLNALQQLNPGIRVIFTVSPVRHWKDGAVNNQLSKSILHISIHELIRNHPNTRYFPAYEIFMDELRDYRFYDIDMLHPSEQGASYVWERFCETSIDDSAKKILAGVTDVLKAVDHRPRQTDSPNLKEFIENTLKRITQLTLSYPFLDFTHEISLLREKLSFSS